MPAADVTRWLALVLAAATPGVFPPGATPAARPSSAHKRPAEAAFRAVTYNVAALSVDSAGVVKTLQSLNPDVVCLQETDRLVGRSGNVDQPALLGAQLGMHHTFASTIPLEGGEYGLALLSRSPLLGVRRVALPQLGQEEPRILVLADTTVAGRTLTVACTHLAANWHAENPDAIRAAQAARVGDTLAALKGPWLLLGDFNMDPPQVRPHLPRQATRPGNALQTYPAKEPKQAFDQAWLGPPGAFVIRKVHTLRSAASDHLPLVVDLGWATP
jgi:endonuclease/exonuclease/phosphatase family metal-dependent hydrolase